MAGVFELTPKTDLSSLARAKRALSIFGRFVLSRLYQKNYITFNMIEFDNKITSTQQQTT